MIQTNAIFYTNIDIIIRNCTQNFELCLFTFLIESFLLSLYISNWERSDNYTLFSPDFFPFLYHQSVDLTGEKRRPWVDGGLFWAETSPRRVAFFRAPLSDLTKLWPQTSQSAVEGRVVPVAAIKERNPWIQMKTNRNRGWNNDLNDH